MQEGVVEAVGDDVVDANREMHSLWHELDAAVRACEESGDASGAARLRSERDAVGQRFAAQNLAYARHLAGRWAKVSPGNSEDYLAAAYEKLWAAFFSWDPERGTFSTWARSHIEGGVRREVARQEFSEKSYEDFNTRPRLTAAAESLRERLGRAPSSSELQAETGIPVGVVEKLAHACALLDDGSGRPDVAQLAAASGVNLKTARSYLSSVARLSEALSRPPTFEEISADTGVPIATIERVLAPRPVRLDAPVSEDGVTTVGDRVASAVPDAAADGLRELRSEEEWVEHLSMVVEDLSGLQLWVLLRAGGLDGAHPQRRRDVSAQIGVGRETVRRAELMAVELLKGPLPVPL